MPELFTDLASSTLSSGIALGATSLTVQSGDGALYPSPTGGDFFRLFLFKKSTGESEFVVCTARTGDVITCAATTRAYNAGDVVELRPTAAFFNSLTVTDTAIQSDSFNFDATDTGSADVYKVQLSPALVAYSNGLSIKFVPAFTNTGAATLEDTTNTLAATTILNVDGGALVAGQIVAGVPAYVMYHNSNFYLINPAIYNVATIHATTLFTAENFEVTQYSEEAASYAVSGAVSLDCSTATYFYPSGTVTGIQTFSFTNPAASGRITSITIELSNAAGFTPVWPASVKWTDGMVPVWTSGIDVITLYTRDGGTNWYAAPYLYNVS